MGHNSVISGHPKATGISRVEELSTGPPGLRRHKQSFLSGNKIGSHVESIRTCNLVLDNCYALDLERTFYISSFSRNLISVFKIVPVKTK